MYPQSQFSRITLPSDREALELFCQEQMSSARVSREVDLLVESVEMALDGMPELDKRVVLAGHSRGGILALLIASRMHSVIGVVNFSGGWIGSGCNNSEIFNQRLFVAAGSYPAVSLWIYGENDETFDMVYSARMLMAYSRAGGRAILHTKTIGDESGHGIFNFSRYWSEILSAYLTEITGVR